jgi:DNA-binding response OmpR family regulator
VTTSHTASATVLVVDDDRELADLYADWLETQYSVRRAYGGHEALDALDGAVDVVLLDRQMPRLDGDAVLETIEDRQIYPRVVMVTAVDPTFDILEMSLDDYLVKPVGQTDLHDAVAAMLERETYDHTLQEYFSLASKKAILEAQKPPAELSTSDAYERVTTRVEELGDRADGALDGFDGDFESVFQDVTGIREPTGRR